MHRMARRWHIPSTKSRRERTNKLIYTFLISIAGVHNTGYRWPIHEFISGWQEYQQQQQKQTIILLLLDIQPKHFDHLEGTHNKNPNLMNNKKEVIWGLERMRTPFRLINSHWLCSHRLIEWMTTRCAGFDRDLRHRSVRDGQPWRWSRAVLGTWNR